MRKRKKGFCKHCEKFKEVYAKELCHSCYLKKNYIDNKEEKIAASKKCYQENKARYRKYYLENKTKYRKYYQENKEKVIIAAKKWRKENSGKAKAARIKWYKEYPGKRREYNLKRRVNGVIEKNIIDKIITENILKYGEIVCEKCKEKCSDNYHVDHIHPLSKGGTNDYCNLQILCAHCNHSKYTEIADYRQTGQRQQPFLRI